MSVLRALEELHWAELQALEELHWAELQALEELHWAEPQALEELHWACSKLSKSSTERVCFGSTPYSAYRTHPLPPLRL